MQRHPKGLYTSALCLCTLVGAAIPACGDSGSGTAVPPAGSGDLDASVLPDGSGGSFLDSSVGDSSLSDAQLVTIEPDSPEITVETGQPVPTLAFVAKVGNNAVPAQWLLDRGEIGTIGQHDGIFTPAGVFGGEATVVAVVGAQQATTSVRVLIKNVQNGASGGDAGTGYGGWGGVGGEGPGVPVDQATIGLLHGAAQADPALAWLYPYDGTVWPTGILAPLLQWKHGAAPAEAVRIRLSSSFYDYDGTFGPPAALPTGAPIVHHPIPQDVWKAATQSSGGSTLSVSLTIASGGVAYGPITQTWRIASGPLKGTVYYQSYGTSLAKNYCCNQGTNELFGGATLAIRGESTDPVLVAGGNGGHQACRVCHSVSANGSRMIVQHGDKYEASSSYALTAGYAETPYGPGDLNKFGWVGLSPDGALGLGNGAPLAAGSQVTSLLYDMDTGAPIPSNGLDTFVKRAGFPAFSPDGKHVAFNFFGGPGDANTGPGTQNKLVVMDFDATTFTFSNPRLVFEGAQGQCPGWPSFLPSSDAVIFSVQSCTNSGGEFMMTRNGGRGELWWADVATGTAHPLEAANGKNAGASYLPVGGNNHDDDTTLQYEPTVNPVVSGGYAWVVFTSRRAYGNVATIDPWWSDPRYHDLINNVTPKKLWVAAIDLGAQPGADRSHPAFYLPAQELMAGNTRGFWVVDPCKPDGQSCESGDQCCGGYCQQDGDSGGLICANHTIECSNEYEKCETDADCCDFLSGTRCINGRCAEGQGPR